MYTHSVSKPWLTSGIRISSINKKKLYLAQRNSNNINLISFYKKYCKILTSVIKLAKKHNNNNIISISSNKIKTTWNIVKSTLNIKPNVPNISTIRVNDNLSSTAQIIAEEFNNYFVSAVQNNHVLNDTSNHENPITYLSRAQTFPLITLKYVSSKEIADTIKSLKAKSSYGYDGISTEILKVSSPYISSPLTYLCNRMLATGIFPQRLKFSEIKPIYKKVIKGTHLITDLFHCLHQAQRSLKK
jgi:hypothetical protein